MVQLSDWGFSFKIFLNRKNPENLEKNEILAKARKAPCMGGSSNVQCLADVSARKARS